MSIETSTYKPYELNSGEWYDLQSLQREAFASSLDRVRSDIDSLVSWADPLRFFTSHIDPNNEVGSKFLPDQSYSSPRVVVAMVSGELAGFGYAANNVSGSPMAQAIKRRSVFKNFLWIREIAVSPMYQKNKVAEHIGRKLLESAGSFQPVSAYVWPEISEHPYKKLIDLGFHQTAKRPVKIFGDESDTVEQLRMEAPNVLSVLKRMN